MSSTFSICSLATLACNILYTWPLVLLGVHFVEVNALYRLLALYVMFVAALLNCIILTCQNFIMSA